MDALEQYAPLPLQDGFDNAGLQIGLTVEQEVAGALLCLDVTEAIVDEAERLGCNLIVAHHPLLFHGLKSITGKSYVERCVVKAIRKGIAIYAAHTNLDNAAGGVNFKIAEKLGLKNLKILSPKENSLLKLVVYVPLSHTESVRSALFAAGCGAIGDYDSCSYNIVGEGTFRAGENCSPYCGEIGELHTEKEVRIETILPSYLKNRVLKALLAVHPYEEPAYDIYSLCNVWPTVGTGVIGELSEPVDAKEFLLTVKDIFSVERLMHTDLQNKKISRVALCGGAGASFARDAVAAGADIYITGEGHYHDMFNYTSGMIMAAIGHYESEQYTSELISEILKKSLTSSSTKATRSTSSTAVGI